ncbi:MAG TPA: type II toxin-antitoxin system VapC family toxin [Rhizomicrobium sp.]|nr:type II toxin-antitoxin system VapC family toxin [Rhizomicrobium sp.]
MILPDVNVLIHAFRKDSGGHAVCKPWLDALVEADTQFGVSPLALAAVVRITTNPRVFREPSPTAETLAFCNNLLTQPHCERVVPGERHWDIFERILRETATRGPRVTDAWFVALAIEHGCTWITLDRDYARFPGLDWREPG